MSETHPAGGYLRFADEHTDAILEGDKTATIRFGVRDRFGVGRVIELVDESDRPFATAVVTSIQRRTAGEIASSRLAGHRSYDDVDDLLTHLGRYYDHVFDAATTFTVIRFQVLGL